MKAIVNVPVCTLHGVPSRESSTEDEVLYGMVVDILEKPAPGWCRIRTHYRYEGFVREEELLTDPEAVAKWQSLPEKIIRNRNFGDVLSEPKVQGWHKIGLPRGAVVKTLSDPVDGWREVILADGRTGFIQELILGEIPRVSEWHDEDSLRRALTEAALLYQGTHYRWGGKTPNGIDCSGLTAMAYMLCGILIYRDAKITEGFPMKEIPLEEMKPGDLLYFPGHVALYLGNDRYCHSTGKGAGVVINSLNPADPDYREDLHKNITKVGSIFTKGEILV